MEECKGTFTLEIGDDEYEIEDVGDISLSGIGFEVSSYLDPDSPVTIVYEEDEKVVSVAGHVVWCQDHPRHHGSYKCGVLFDYSYRDENSQLLLAVKDYIDTTDNPHLFEELEFD